MGFDLVVDVKSELNREISGNWSGDERKNILGRGATLADEGRARQLRPVGLTWKFVLCLKISWK